MRTFSNKKIANKLSIYILFFITIIFILFFTLTLFKMNTLIKSRIENELFVKTESASQKIWNIFENTTIITEQMSFNNEIQAYLKTTKTYEDITGNPLYANVYKTLVDIQKSYSLNFLAWVANEEANFYLDSDGTIPDKSYDVKKRPWYEVAVSNKEVTFTSPYMEWGTKSMVISAIKALREDNIIYGFVVVDMKLDSIPEIFEKIDIGNTSSNFLIDQNGTYIYNKDTEKILNSNVFDQTDILKPYSAEILSKKRGFQEIIIDGNPWYLSYRPATQSGWVMISLINKLDTQNELSDFTFYLLVIFIVSIVILLIIIYYTIRNITLPMSVITNYGNEIAIGNLNSELPPIFSDRSDEIGELSRAFITITNVFKTQNSIFKENLDQKNSELELQYKYILETEKLASLGNLVAGVSHEINTPLGIGLTSASYIENLSKKTKNSLNIGTLSKASLVSFIDEVDEANALLISNLERAAELVKSFKRVAVDQTNEIKSKFNLYEHIYSIIISLKHEYKNTNITIENNCPKDIELNSYPGPLTQVFTNLIMNSLSHAYDKNDIGKINISAKFIDSSKIEICYTDDGKGIRSSDLANIFEPFFTTNRQNGNSGLGMFIIKNIVNQILGGTILCNSIYGQGVEFIITIPIEASTQHIN